MTDKILSIADDLYDNIDPVYHKSSGSSVIKSNYTRSDYGYYRDGVSQIESRVKKLAACQEAYNSTLLFSIINLMCDFTSKGVRIRHPDKSKQKILDTWFKKVEGIDRTERILSSLYRLGTVIIYHVYGRASNSYLSKYIPVEYKLLNPMSIDIKDETPGIINGNFEYILRYSQNSYRNYSESAVSLTPKALERNIREAIPLNKNRLTVYNYRKDDWEHWGHSIIYPVLSELEVLEKLRLADISALDGVISNVRLWTVGKITDNPQTTFLPSNAQLKKVQSLIQQGVGGGSLDLVMGPEVDFKESSTSIHQFLGESKYKPTLDAIYDKIGIPSVLRSANSNSRATDDLISLKTFIEKLNYGRNIIVDFWTTEAKKVLKAFELEDSDSFIDPTVEFDYMVLSDEAAEKKLLIELADRNMIDSEFIHDKFRANTNIVNAGLKSDEELRKSKQIPPKAGPFYDPQLELREKIKTKISNTTKKSNDGRPPNVIETNKRNKKGTGPDSSKAKLIIWASEAQNKISDICTPKVLKHFNKKDVRSLTKEETDKLEMTKASVLLNIEPFSDIDESIVLNSLSMGKNNFIPVLSSMIKEYELELGVLTTGQKRQFNSIFYASIIDGEN